jgi:hypothetical protein
MLLPFLLSQIFLIDKFASKFTLNHSAIISEIFQEVDVIKSEQRSDILLMKIMTNMSPELKKYLKQVPTRNGYLSVFPSWFIQGFQLLEHYKGFVWTTEFLYHLFGIHQRLFMNFPTFISGKQGIGKTEILACLSELYSFANDKFLHINHEKSMISKYFLLLGVRFHEPEIYPHPKFPFFQQVSIDSLFTERDFLLILPAKESNPIIFLDELNTPPDS